MISKQDYALAGLIGFFAGMFAIPVFFNIGMRNPFVLLALPWAIAVCALIGMAIANVLGKKFAIIIQFAKFVVVGVLNTAIDFGILNIMSLVTGLTSGFIIGGVNIPGVIIALTNAYLWNKLWVFGAADGKGLFHDLPKFLLVSGIGVIINSGIVILATSYPVQLIDAQTWLNIAKVMATGFSLVWNFLGYKFIVFSKTSNVPMIRPSAPIAPL
ncbi:MAG: GtrA family protein [Candidatus Sungbacteria bacterium]|nr:GtrA family protein [bacterium]MDZ4260045.1 GtrA family protein [Candidatus Sungbacteria bacterium]